jgi:beta-phosphoglucomutase-like phosphatase (HAD superfamily)
LIDSVDLHAQSWLETFERFGVQASFADVRRHIPLFRQRYTEQIEVADAAAIMERWES